MTRSSIAAVFVFAASIFVLIVLLGATTAQAASVEQCGFRANLNMSLDRMASWVLFDARGPMERAEGRRACDYYTLATIYQFERQNDKALEYYQKVIGWWRTYGDAYEGLGDLYTALGKPELAAQAYSQSLLTTRDSADGLYYRCWDRAVRGYPLNRALADCTAALKEYPASANVHQARCLVYFRSGKFDSAIADCTAALASWPNMSGAFYVRGLSELAKDDRVAGDADIAAAKKEIHRISEFYAYYGITLPAAAGSQETSR